MMCIQAREMFPPRVGKTHPLRSYPANSPRAKARLVVLALLADGKLARSELETLGHEGVFQTLGISRTVFFEVMADFCTDLVSLPEGAGSYLLTPETVEGLLMEVRDPVERRALISLILDLVCSDGRLAPGEESLVRQTLAAWGIRPPGAAGPEHYYG